MKNQSDRIEIPNGSYAVQTIYTDQVLPEYNDNPLIRALPPILSEADFVGKVTRYPLFSLDERHLDSRYRFHCIERLSRHYFQPLDRHIELHRMIATLLMQGYLSRNIAKPEYATRLRQIHQALVQGGDKYLQDCVKVESSASGTTLIGPSGCGKSTALNSILSLYPQIIYHRDYSDLHQLVWLKLDCPHSGSLKDLCIDFFLAVDRLLGTQIYTKFGKRGNSEGHMLAQVAQIASNQALGILVIDEIQNLTTTKTGVSERMLNFFVKLVNTIGVPVIRIGTNKAIRILQGDFRHARRGIEQGGMIWDRLKESDEAWHFFMEGMFQYQWTKEYVPFTTEMSRAIYYESQGIVDIGVKLYKMVQWRAIALGTETITKQLIHKVAEDSLHLIQPMMNAIRSGDANWISKYEDISPIDIADYYQNCLTHLEAKDDTRQQRVVLPQPPATLNLSAILKKVIFMLVSELDVEPVLAKRSAEEALASTAADADVPSLVKSAYQLALQNGRSETVQRKTTKRKQTKPVRQTDDLCFLVENGLRDQKSGYEALNDQELIKDPVEEFLLVL